MYRCSLSHLELNLTGTGKENGDAPAEAKETCGVYSVQHKGVRKSSFEQCLCFKLQTSRRRKLTLVGTFWHAVNIHTGTRRKNFPWAWPRKSLAITGIWGLGILVMTLLLSTIHIHSEFHLLSIVYDAKMI